MKKIILTPAVWLGVFLLAAVAPASAGPYFGASIGQASVDIQSTDPNTTVDDSDTDWKLYGGWRFFRFLALEAGFADLGGASATTTSPSGDSTMNVSADGFTVAAMGVFPVGQKFDLFAKMGYLYWDADVDVSDPLFGSTTFSDDGDDSILGAGFVWNYPGPGAARMEYEQSEIGGTDVDSISAGLTFMF